MSASPVAAMAHALCVVLAMPLMAHAESCGRFPESGFDNPDAPRIDAGYANEQYGYAVRVPAGQVGYGVPSPAPNHGFIVLLSWKPRAYLYVDGNYEVADDDTLAKQAVRLGKFTRGDAVRVLSTMATRTRLGPLPAMRLVSRYECKGLRGLYLTDEVVALSPDLSVVYTVSLSTTTKRYRADKVALEEVLRSFALPGRPVP